jgi:hypothetical protein
VNQIAPSGPVPIVPGATGVLGDRPGGVDRPYRRSFEGRAIVAEPGLAVGSLGQPLHGAEPAEAVVELLDLAGRGHVSDQGVVLAFRPIVVVEPETAVGGHHDIFDVSFVADVDRIFGDRRGRRRGGLTRTIKKSTRTPKPAPADAKRAATMGHADEPPVFPRPLKDRDCTQWVKTDDPRSSQATANRAAASRNDTAVTHEQLPVACLS